MKYFLAIDLGATSGRHVIGYKLDGEIQLKEIHRFRTEMDDSPDGLVWNVPRILNEIKEGIRKAFEIFPKIESISIDTWGVDYVLINGDKEIPPYYAYRNERCQKSAQKVHKIIDFKDIYRKTGIQFAAFNTLYQLYDDKQKRRLDNATDYLMLPSYFSYKLTGIKTHEYTNESTGALLNVKTGDYNYELLDKLELPRRLFNKMQKPGSIVGDLLPEIQKEVGGNSKVILCASHDTASAFESVNVDDESIILSSGTWSLLGIKSKTPIVSEESLNSNYTNEGGVGYIRFLKNIMGMYLANRVREETGLHFRYIDSVIYDSKYKETFDVNDPSLSAPKNMKQAILGLLKDNPPKNDIDLFASIYRSQAICYKKAIDELEMITG
ncbi:rhamnulokinase family protein, partial [Methanobrevibacter sp.]|uniref:rhamnulokinase n=1 Tax=Methanobrevibacter sp. TaxID=66852 RepID=UPI00386AE1CF